MRERRTDVDRVRSREAARKIHLKQLRSLYLLVSNEADLSGGAESPLFTPPTELRLVSVPDWHASRACLHESTGAASVPSRQAPKSPF